MSTDFKKKLEELRKRKNQVNETPTTSKLGGLRNRLSANKNPANSSDSSLRNKFKKRDQTVLDRTYEDRNERSKSSSVGKTLFNQELMAECGIEDFATTIGDRFIEILPISFDPLIPYFKELSVHFGVGFAKDAYLCLNRFKSNSIRHNGRCYRCERQQVMWRDQDTFTKDQTKELYPLDRACYLIWERTKELVDGESPDFVFKLWAAPKVKVHSEIQEKVRDKLHRTTLDISDLSVNGDGRTVSFTIVKGGKYPDYKAFDLIKRDEPIPEEVINKLDEIIQLAESQGFSNCIEMFLNIPKYEEIQESMATDDEDTAAGDSDQDTTGKHPLATSNQCQQEQPADSIDDTELLSALEDMQTEMEETAKKPLIWRKWLKDNGYDSVIGTDPLEAIPLIINDMYEKEIARLSGMDN